MLPTVAELTGQLVPDNLDGESLLGAVLGRPPPPRGLLHWCGSRVMAVRASTPAGAVWKAVLAEPRLTVTGGCRAELCPCYGRDTLTHNPPLVYDIARDPSEARPLDPASQQYSQVWSGLLRPQLEQMLAGVERDRLPSQLEDRWRVLPAPWLQPIRTV